MKGIALAAIFFISNFLQTDMKPINYSCKNVNNNAVCVVENTMKYNGSGINSNRFLSVQYVTLEVWTLINKYNFKKIHLKYPKNEEWIIARAKLEYCLMSGADIDAFQKCLYGSYVHGFVS